VSVSAPRFFPHDRIEQQRVISNEDCIYNFSRLVNLVVGGGVLLLLLHAAARDAAELPPLRSVMS
jgi:hypothetical protein